MPGLFPRGGGGGGRMLKFRVDRRIKPDVSIASACMPKLGNYYAWHCQPIRNLMVFLFIPRLTDSSNIYIYICLGSNSSYFF